MYAHHQAVIERLIDRFGSDPAFPALIVGGSIVRGWERADSDVDIIMVANDEEYARRAAQRAPHYFTRDLCDYPGGYVDGKIVNQAFLEEVAERGSDPIRSAFVNAIVAYNRVPDLSDLLRRITRYPEEQQAERLGTFYAHFEAWRWYTGEAFKRGDRYLIIRSLGNLVLFGGRLILAHNRQFYPYHKWLTTVLREAPARPDGLPEMIDALLCEPSRETAERFSTAILGFAEWPKPAEGWPARFMEVTEWAWRRGAAPVEDW